LTRRAATEPQFRRSVTKYSNEEGANAQENQEGAMFQAIASTPRRTRWAAALLVLALSAGPVFAQSGSQPNTANDGFAPVEEYARKVEEFTKSAPELNKRIEESAKVIEELTDVGKARKEIEQLRAVIGELLGEVSDNSRLAQLGGKALTQARAKLQQLERESRFKPEETKFLVDQWREVIRQTEQASGDLDNARKEFVELLRMLQTREDFIDELMQVRRAAEAIKVIRQLTSDIRMASEKLKTLIGGIKPPGV
jgi:DNA repair exonuclease SbcCD ATPase subunit